MKIAAQARGPPLAAVQQQPIILSQQQQVPTHSGDARSENTVAGFGLGHPLPLSRGKPKDTCPT